jgi:hypothetical protein
MLESGILSWRRRAGLARLAVVACCFFWHVMFGVQLDHCQLLFSLDHRHGGGFVKGCRTSGLADIGTPEVMQGGCASSVSLTDDSASSRLPACHGSPAKSNARFPAAYHTRGNSLTGCGAWPANAQSGGTIIGQQDPGIGRAPPVPLQGSLPGPGFFDVRRSARFGGKRRSALDPTSIQ